jgi:hypothetical protein
MRTLWIAAIGLLLLYSLSWAQLTVQNSSGTILMQVEEGTGEAIVTVGSTGTLGKLVTHSLTITDGAAQDKVLVSDTDGNASWGSVSITETDPEWTANDNDHRQDNETPLAGTAISVSNRTVSVKYDNSTIKVNGSGQLYAVGDGFQANTDNQDLSYTNLNAPTGHYVNHRVEITGGSNATIRDYYDPNTTEDPQPLWEVLTDGNDADGNDALDFDQITLGTSNAHSDARLTIQAHSPGRRTGLYVTANAGGPALEVYGYGGVVPGTEAIYAYSDNTGSAVVAEAGDNGTCFLATGPGDVRLENSDDITGVDGILYFGSGTGASSVNINRQNDDLSLGAPGNIKFQADNIIFNGSNIHSSDQRWKTGVTPISSALDQILDINAVRFFWDRNDRTDDHAHYGVLAQELEQVIPELVVTDDDGYKYVNYNELIPFLIGGMQEQQHRIQQLEAHLTELSGAMR